MDIYIYCEKSLLFVFIEYINSILANYNDLVLIFDYNELKTIISNIANTNDKIIFIQTIPDLSDISNIMNQIYLVNTEQLSREDWSNKIQTYLDNGIKIIDYSKANLQRLKLLNIKTDFFYIPYLVNNNEIYNYDKIYDVAHVGTGSKYRMDIIDNLKNYNILINHIRHYGTERDNLLFKSKILIIIVSHV
jgi:hypothetical protein